MNGISQRIHGFHERAEDNFSGSSIHRRFGNSRSSSSSSEGHDNSFIQSLLEFPEPRSYDRDRKIKIHGRRFYNAASQLDSDIASGFHNRQEDGKNCLDFLLFFIFNLNY